jgi:glycosyltransferase involved in cell wall biosynthesis
MKLIDSRWEGNHGIGRFAREIGARLQDFQPVRLRGKPYDPLDPLRLSAHLYRTRPALYFSPGYNSPFLSPCPFVATIHDLNHLVVPENSSALKRAYFRRFVLPAVRRSAVVLTVSEFSRQAICEWAQISPSKVTNVGNGISSAFTTHGQKHIASRPYLLYVGNHKAHKNFTRLLEAFAASKLAPEMMLLSTGDASSQYRNQIEHLRLRQDVEFVGPQSDEQLAELYRGATALVLVSLYEGFGLPIVEAMACGTPVLTSNCASMPEIADEAALLVDPTNVGAITNGLVKIVADSELRLSLVAKGIDVAKRFSWDATAIKVKSALEIR